ncbi:MAG: hypothetical protein HY466_05160 [Deltaproteobacteria bacterium]|nr:hypothetical protein [Deltaproteobacteria bacterium]
MAAKALLQLENTIKKLRRRWPKSSSKEVEGFFDQMERDIAALKARRPRGAKKSRFNLTGLVQQVLKIHDILFLNRHLTYHVVASSDLPLAAGSEEEALTVFGELLETAARRAAFGSKLEIHIQKIDTREGPAIQTRLAFEGKALSDLDRRRFIEEIYGGPQKETEMTGMSTAKNILRHVGGKFWMEFPRETCVGLILNWPAEGAAAGRPGGFATFKYDIWLTEYNRIRQRFGIPKADRLMTQIESCIRSLVRHPIDIVIAFPDRGMVTTIYESQEGAASSVAGRISGRLRKESFRIGKKNITPKFRYQLTDLT